MQRLLSLLSKALFLSLLLLLLGVVLFGCADKTLPDGLPGDYELESPVHPTDYVKSERHGLEYLQDYTRCSFCHGQQRQGGISGVVCDECHQSMTGRRMDSDCGFCHSAPSFSKQQDARFEDVYGNKDKALAAVGAHDAHALETEIHTAYACSVCHPVYASLDDSGHLDETPAADVVFTGLAGSRAAYDSGECSSILCHGDGVVTADAPAWTDENPLGCNSCHDDGEHPESMYGSHEVHVLAGLTCAGCHMDVVDGQNTIIDKQLHVNGEKDILLALGQYDPATRTCTNTCHADAEWGGEYHPSGFVAKERHGRAFILHEQDCTRCHGEDLQGGGSGVSCDGCHLKNADATLAGNCTFCHGGVDNESGAPPEGVFGESERSDPQVGAHSRHVSTTEHHGAFDCSECHTKPASFTDAGHLDGDGQAEVALKSGSYDSESGVCSANECHGNGRTSGSSPTWTSVQALTCTGCHDDGSRQASSRLSGMHDKHVRDLRLDCTNCHKAVLDAQENFVNVGLHVNGQADVELSIGTYNAQNKSCSTSCHEEIESWYEDR